jgi:hypothetical protein
MNDLAIKSFIQAGKGEFWQVLEGGDVPYIAHRRATYYEHLPWREHPWAEKNAVDWGADFDHDWALESEHEGQWSSDGRNGELAMPLWLRQGTIFDTELAARRYLIGQLRSYRDATRLRARAYERALLKQMAALAEAGER